MNKTDLNTVTITCPNQQCSNEFDYRIDDIRAALGIVQLSKLEGDLAKRQRIRITFL